MQGPGPSSAPPPTSQNYLIHSKSAGAMNSGEPRFPYASPRYYPLSMPSQKAAMFKCPEPGCGREFTRKSNLKTHARFHSQETPYHCEICNTRFVWKSGLSSHWRKQPACYEAYTAMINDRVRQQEAGDQNDFVEDEDEVEVDSEPKLEEEDQEEDVEDDESTTKVEQGTGKEDQDTQGNTAEQKRPPSLVAPSLPLRTAPFGAAGEAKTEPRETPIHAMPPVKISPAVSSLSARKPPVADAGNTYETDKNKPSAFLKGQNPSQDASTNESNRFQLWSRPQQSEEVVPDANTGRQQQQKQPSLMSSEAAKAGWPLPSLGRAASSNTPAPPRPNFFAIPPASGIVVDQHFFNMLNSEDSLTRLSHIANLSDQVGSQRQVSEPPPAQGSMNLQNLGPFASNPPQPPQLYPGIASLPSPRQRMESSESFQSASSMMRVPPQPAPISQPLIQTNPLDAPWMNMPSIGSFDFGIPSVRSQDINQNVPKILSSGSLEHGNPWTFSGDYTGALENRNSPKVVFPWMRSRDTLNHPNSYQSNFFSMMTNNSALPMSTLGTAPYSHPTLGALRSTSFDNPLMAAFMKSGTSMGMSRDGNDASRNFSTGFPSSGPSTDIAPSSGDDYSRPFSELLQTSLRDRLLSPRSFALRSRQLEEGKNNTDANANANAGNTPSANDDAKKQ